jgi:hypothetical protein
LGNGWSELAACWPAAFAALLTVAYVTRLLDQSRLAKQGYDEAVASIQDQIDRFQHRCKVSAAVRFEDAGQAISTLEHA